jgi:Zn-dependent protease with chaperone function
MPFRAYAELFLKTTLTVSREQEFVADRTAARVAVRLLRSARSIAWRPWRQPTMRTSSPK